LNVLLIYYEPAPAGQTTHVLALARSLDRTQHRITVVLPDHLERSIAELKQAPVQVVPLPLRKVLWPARTAIALARLIRSERIDIVHIHSLEAGLCGRVVARLSSAHLSSGRPRTKGGPHIKGAPRIVYTPQTIDIRRSRWQWLYRRIERGLAHFTDVIVSVNDADRQRLIDWGIPPLKVVTIPNGIDLRAFEEPVDVPDVRRSLRLAPDRPLVMQVARLSPQKDPLAFVNGAARVIAERPDAQFALVGEGPLREETEARVRALGVDGCVHLLGWRNQAHRLMAAADIVTLTSRWEGSPYSLLEAMAWSRPVIATAVNGCSEIVAHGHTGFLAPPGDAAAWASHVLALLNDPAMAARMGRAGREQVEHGFSLRSTISRTESLYRRLSRP
jgi:glycosyltransferase involved in cell wall biosynthesis